MQNKYLKKLQKHLPLALVLVIFCVICSIAAQRAIWFDESYSASLIKGNCFQIWDMTAYDVHPPLYYWFLRIWSLIFGRSLYVLRSFSIVAGMLTIIVLYILFKRWSKSDKTALILSSLFAICPFFLYYSSEMRMYSFMALIVALGTLFLDLALEKNQKKYWLLYALTIVAGLYTHYFTAFAFIAHLIYLIYYFIKHGFNKNILWTYALVIILYIPWIPNMINQIVGVEKQFWPDPVELMTIPRFFSFSLFYFRVTESDLFYGILTLFSIVLFVVLASIAHKNSGQKTRTKILEISLLTFVPPLIMIAISLIGQSVYVERYTAYSLAFLWVLYGIFILTIKNSHKSMFIISSIFIGICVIIGTSHIVALKDSRTDISDMALEIRKYKEESDVPVPIIYGGSDSASVDLVFFETEKNPVYNYNVNQHWGAIRQIIEYKENYIPDLAEFKKNHSDYWLIARNYGDSDIFAKETFGDKYEVLTLKQNETFRAYRVRKVEK